MESDLDEHTLGRPLPPFSIQPLVENAVRHGIAPKPAGGTIRIDARLERGDLIVTVEDDGAGAKNFTTGSFGHGLRSLQHRLAVAYGEGARLDIDTAPSAGFRAKLTVPNHMTNGPTTAV